jgi:predicted RNA-binding Zn ribbon-like protein
MGNPASKPNSDWKDGFLFVGNHPALDFLNTRPVQDGQALELLPDFNAVLRWYQAAGLLSHSVASDLQRRWEASAQAQRTADSLRALREKLRNEILSWEEGGTLQSATLEELNRLMAQHPMRTRLKTTGQRAAKELYFEAHEPEDLFAPLAYSAGELFASADRKRVRRCAQCVLHFYDTSKKGTRRWCSMGLCGNRHKVAAYAARQRQQRRHAERANADHH